MAGHKQQEQDLRAGLQHLAHLRQDLVQHLGASVLQHQQGSVNRRQVALAEVGLEAHLQDLERFRQQQ
jgi:hypothetical protein